jgi:Histidine kinase
MPSRARLAELFRFAIGSVAVWLAVHAYVVSVVLRWTSHPPAEVPLDTAAAALLWALVSPLLFAIVERVPVAAPHRLRNLALLLLAVPAVSALRACILVAVWPPRIWKPFWELVAAQTLQGLTFAAMTALVAHVVVVLREAAARERRRFELEALLARARSDQLRGRIPPAYLFATLDSIAKLVRIDAGAADRMLMRLSELLRAVMDLERQGTATLEEELDFIDLYLELHPSRVRWRIDSDQRLLQARIPALVLHPLVEAATAARLPITIRALIDRELQLEVSVAGPLDAEACIAAVRIVRDRLTVLFGDAARLRTGDTHAFCATLSLPLLLDEEAA